MSVSPDAASPAVDPERRAALNGVKLAGLVAARWGPADRRRGAFGTTATLLEPVPDQPAGTGTGHRADAGPEGSDAPGEGTVGTRRRTGWVLPDGETDRALGPALAWADRQGVDELHVVAEPGADAAGLLARQAGLFAPAPSVWAVHGTSLAPAEPAPPPAPAAAPAPSDLVDLLIDAGLEIVVEGGMVRGEINGLEVARIVHGHTTAGEPIDAPRLEVGVGKADRELTAMVHSGMPAIAQLERVIEIVRRHRRAGAPRHPLNQLVPDRWLRAVLSRTPELVGLRALRPAEGARPRPNLSVRDIAVATGETPDGDPVVLACTVGIALDLVPTAADARVAIDALRPSSAPPSALVLAVPARDDHPSIRQLAARLRVPARVVAVPGDWQSEA